MARIWAHQGRNLLYRTQVLKLRCQNEILKAKNAKLVKAKQQQAKLKWKEYRKIWWDKNLASGRMFNKMRDLEGKMRELQEENAELKHFVPRRYNHRQIVEDLVAWLDWNDPFLP